MAYQPLYFDKCQILFIHTYIYIYIYRERERQDTNNIFIEWLVLNIFKRA